MRLNSKKFQQIMDEKGITETIICERTGLYEKSFRWIMDNRSVSEDAIERIADAAGVDIGDIYLPDSTSNIENAIEFIKDSERAIVTFSQGRYKTKIRNLAAERPEECEILAENKDGSICAHVPVAWVKISPPKSVSEEQRMKAREQMQRYHLKNGSTLNKNK